MAEVKAEVIPAAYYIKKEEGVEVKSEPTPTMKSELNPMIKEEEVKKEPKEEDDPDFRFPTKESIMVALGFTG